MKKSAIAISASVYAICLLIGFSCLFYVSYNYAGSITETIHAKQRARLDPKTNDPGLTPINWTQVANIHPDTVVSGMYVERILDFDMAQSHWSFETYVWFRWNPKKTNFMPIKEKILEPVSPANAPFKIINGDITDLMTEDTYINPSGDSAYVLFLAKMTCTQFFDVATFPLNNHELLIEIEHNTLDCNTMYFLPDSAASKISSRFNLSGFKIDKGMVLSKFHTYKSALGDPRKAQDYTTTFSQLRFGIPIKRGSISIFTKLFAALYISILVSFLSFFAEEKLRISVAIGSLYATVASLYIILTKIPVTDIISVGEVVNIVSLVTIGVIICHETLGKYFVKENTALYNINKWITFFVTFTFYIIFNIAIPHLVYYAK